MVFGQRGGHRIRRAGVALISLAGVLLALGAVPASASSVASDEHGTAAVTSERAQPSGLTANAVSSSEVDLSWNAGVDGLPPGGYYNVYDGTTKGAESGPVNAGPVTGTTFQVTTGLNAGTTYFFVVTAVDAAGNESDPSNEAQATTPTPGPGLLWGVLGGLAAIGAAIVGVLVWRRLRRPPPPPPSVVKAVPDAGPPPAISVHATGTGTTHTVRIEPHPGTSITTIEEAPR